MNRVFNEIIDNSVSAMLEINSSVYIAQFVAKLSYSISKKSLPRKKKKKLKKTIDLIGKALVGASESLDKNILYMSLLKECINPKRTITKITI